MFNLCLQKYVQGMRDVIHLRKKGGSKSATAGSVPVRMQRIGVSKTLTRFLSTAANDADDHEVANGQDP